MLPLGAPFPWMAVLVCCKEIISSQINNPLAHSGIPRHGPVGPLYICDAVGLGSPRGYGGVFSTSVPKEIKGESAEDWKDRSSATETFQTAVELDRLSVLLYTVLKGRLRDGQFGVTWHGPILQAP